MPLNLTDDTSTVVQLMSEPVLAKFKDAIWRH